MSELATDLHQFTLAVAYYDHGLANSAALELFARAPLTQTSHLIEAGLG